MRTIKSTDTIYFTTSMAASLKILKESIRFPDNSLQGSSGVSVGTILMYAGLNMNDISGNFLLCNGGSLDARANPQYTDLYNVIETSYGGTGDANFKVPDFRGRIPKHFNRVILNGGTNQIAYENLPHTHVINNLALRKNSNNHKYDGSNSSDRRVLTTGFNRDKPTVTLSNILDDNGNPINSQEPYYPPYCAVNYIICYKQ